MLAGISIKWLPLLAYFAITTTITDRFFPSHCDDYLAKPERLQVYAKPEAREFIESKVVALNDLLGDLRLTRAKIYGVKEHEAKRSFFYFERLFAGMKNLKDNPEKTATIFTHEFAHAVFAEHFRIVFNGQKFSVNSLKQEVLRIIRQKKVAASNLALLEIGSMLLEYNELFADTVVVLATGDPNSISRAHEFASALELGLSNDFLPEGMFATPKWRALDFTSRLDLEAWEKYLDDQLNDPDFQAQIHYRTFSPMRGIIWRRFLQNLPLEQRSVFLRIFLEASSEHIVERGAFRANGGHESNKALNEEFLNILTRRSVAAGIAVARDHG